MPGAPLIGISAGRIPAGNRTIDGADRDYSRAVQLAGGAPVVLPSTSGTDIGSLIGRMNGLLLSGGGDVEPARYGAAPSEATGGIDADRDAIELGLLAAAMDRGIPVLGVCRGCQVVNVALGGTLHQHVPDVSSLDHLHREPRDWLAHPVSVEKGSLLHRVVGRDRLEVNSIHHQAVDRLARPLRAVACAPDGIIEAVEDPQRPILAVQWHPESLMPAEPHLALFRWLVEAAS